MSAAAIIALILQLAPQAINVAQLVQAAIARRDALQNTPNRSDVDDAELAATQAIIDALQAHIDQQAAATGAANG
jgi:hypothetical protein